MKQKQALKMRAAIYALINLTDPMNPENESNPRSSTAHITNPCDGCDLKEWCSDDDCGKKGYPIDMPTTRFKNLNDMITYFRTHNVLGL